MSSEDLAWRPLPLPLLPGLPGLLVSAEMGNASYTVRVTDMANMWTESLERKAICMRGWSRNTSIDPSDTPENMAKFLTSLKAALDSSQPGHEDTSLDLSPPTTADTGEDGLTLNVTCALPGFDPLKWPFYLKKSPPSSIATDLVLPLIQAHYARKRQVESLVQVLGHKDAVLAKLSDKLEAMGTGMEHVFTALSGKRKVTRSVAEDKVKGLAPFDRGQWKAELDDKIKPPDSTGDLVQSVFGDSGLEYGAMMEIDRSPALDNWWHDFKGTSQLAHRKRTQEAPPTKGEPSTPARSTNAGDDDDFQVQATPPHLGSGGKRKARSSAPPPDAASSTGGEDGGDSVIPDSNPPVAVSASTRQSEAKKATSRLGAIGGRKQPAAPRSPTPEAKSSGDAGARKPADDSETASEASDDATASVPGSSPPPAPKPVPATGVKKGGLGRIGGAAPKTCSPEAEEPKERADAPAPRKLGVIGNKIGGASPAKTAREDTGRGRASTRKEEACVEETRETSQERADRRREELKRELEKKAAAGPAKKKRRF